MDGFGEERGGKTAPLRGGRFAFMVRCFLSSVKLDGKRASSTRMRAALASESTNNKRIRAIAIASIAQV